MSYRGATLTWNGRLLMSYEKDGTKYAYTYNADNLRTSKSKYVNNTLVSQETYIWSGDVLVATKKYDCATATSDIIRYLYDSNGESNGFTYNGNTYLYVKNLQGDVIAIISAGDELLCLGLNYDPWGKVTYMTDEEASEYELQVAQEIAAINNIAYRGYFYDSQTGLYYLQSRYYDPEVGRFINADDVAFIGYDSTSLSINLFSYCANNPINRRDPTGNIAIVDDVLFSSLAIFVIGILTVAASKIVIDTYLNSFGFRNAWSKTYSVINSYAYNDRTKLSNISNTIFNWSGKRLSVTIKSVKLALTIVKADAKIRSTVRKNSKARYWSANFKSDYVDLGRALTYKEALQMVKANKNVFTVTKSEAKALAKAAYSNKKPKGPENHGDGELGYYNHFHVYKHKYKGHIWYLF